MNLIEYNRQKAKEYAKKWVYQRNPKYYNYDAIGGDCTNFISQCIYAGSGIMNYKDLYGWYYISANNKSPSWTGVEFLHNFLINNKGVGPFGEISNDIEIGDVIQLSFDGSKFTHSLLVVGIENGKILIATHTFDAYARELSSYSYRESRFIHINGVRKE